MKKRIEDLIQVIESGIYDQEIVHGDYDRLLEDFIQNYDPDLQERVVYLIGLEKDFWYA